MEQLGRIQFELLDPNWPNATSASPTFLNGASITGALPGYSNADRIGSLFTFPSNSSVVKSKVGVSWISTDKACAFIDELGTWNLQDTAQAATKTWEDEILSKIEVYDTRNTTLLTMFYSAMYRSALLPSNRTGENPFWDDGVPYVDDICKSPRLTQIIRCSVTHFQDTLWDTFRCWFSLQLLIKPAIATDLVNTLISVWRHERFMPDGRSGNYNGRVQGKEAGRLLRISLTNLQEEVMRIMCLLTLTSKALAAVMEVLTGLLDTKASHSFKPHYRN
jgi:putative alpha-1,2-mannosidase